VGRARPQALIPQEAMRGWFGRNGQRLVVHRETGAVVFDARCALGQGLSARTDVADWKWTATAAGRGRVELLEGGIAKVGAYAEAASVPWLVVSLADMQEFTGEYRREQLLYLVFVIFVVVAAGGAFLILAQEVMGSLEDLTVAAERIGEGELTPWLPPPGPDETGRLSLAISLMLARLKAMLRQNEVARRLAVAGEVASQLSHEIRNPLSSIRLNLQSLDRETRSGTVPSDLSQVVRLCLREINRLDNAVSSVLTLGQPMPPELAPCSLGEVVRESLAVLEPRLRARSIVAHADVSSADRILGDEGQLRGVFLNLFLNAVDAMPAGGVLRVWLDHGTGPAGEEVRVHVRDGGEGIRPELRHLVFEPFFTTKASGSGIGLTLARHTVEAHHGRLYLDVARDAEGAGAEFVAAFPLAAGEPDGREAAGRDVGRSKPVRVEA
jgi:two-component system sensor histidine kinase AtoS